MGDMTLAEKIGQLNMLSADWVVTGPQIPVRYLDDVKSGAVGSIFNLWTREATREAQKLALETRLGIPLFFGLDVIHGHRTIFPIGLGEACAFDPALWEKTARASARDAADDGLHLTFAPMIDVCRDPRWGRIAEGPGEDAFVGAAMARAKTRGFQGEDIARPGCVAATAKHFVGYGAAEGGRDYAAVDLSHRQLEEIYLPPFKAAVEAGVAAIMPSFNDLAGVPMTANPAMLDGVLRRRWGFEGVLISDYTAVLELTRHGVAANLTEAAALALNAGLDIDMMSQAFVRHLPEALKRGLVTMRTIDAAVARVLRLKEALGLFDDPFREGAKLKPRDVSSHRALAREAAVASMTLLQNRGDLLPLDLRGQRVAVIGPLADARPEMFGSWPGVADVAGAVTFLDGLRRALPDADLRVAQGVPIEADDASGVAAAVAEAQAADILLLCLGEGAEMSGEAASRARPGLPGRQRDLAEAVLACGRPTVVALCAGRPLAVPWLFEQADAVLATWQPGHEAGHALAQILTGAREPGGRLAVSWPWDVGQIPIFIGQRPTGRPFDAAMRHTSKYLDMPNTPQFPFGHGLGYTRFVYEAPKLSAPTLAPGESVTVTAKASNVGARAGSETVFLFVRDRVACVARPTLELKGFTRIALKPGARGTVRFELKADDLVFLDADLTSMFEPGEVDIYLGPSADPARLGKATLTLVAPAKRKRAGRR
jgi:beta-glucosidase